MFEFDVAKFVPDFILKDKNGYAVAKAIEGAVRYMNNAILDGVKRISDIDSMPEWRLDELAWEYNATWYNYNAGIETKRMQIKGVLEYYNKLGTLFAVKRAISDVYGTGSIEEWFRYGGQPYHFRVYTTNLNEIKNNYDRFLRLLDTVKNTRSVLENVYFYSTEIKTTAHTATKAVGAYIRASAIARKYGEE